MKQVVFPKRKESFYLFNLFLKHIHDSITCESVYVIPWIDGIFITTKRLSYTQGCVGCLVRRLLSTIYHKAAKINGIDSLCCTKELETDKNILTQSTHLNYTQTSKKDNSLTIEDAFNNTDFDIHIEEIRECPGIFVAYTTSKNETWRDISGVPIA